MRKAAFFSDKKEFEKEILSKVDDIALKRSFKELNEKLEHFSVNRVRLSFVDSGAPFNSAFLSQDSEKLDLSITSLGSGIEMIVSLLFLETLASLSKERIIVLIDEPELHLHPSLQEKFTEYIIEFSERNQVFASTHSPYFFKNCLNNDQIKLMVTKNSTNQVVVEDAESQLGLFPWSPSWGEINYSAYNLPTVEFHNELYGYLQEREGKYSIKEIESYFSQTKGISQSKKWTKVVGNNKQPPENVTLMTFIRNSIHHPENTHNNPYTPEELKLSIQEMINLI